MKAFQRIVADLSETIVSNSTSALQSQLSIATASQNTNR